MLPSFFKENDESKGHELFFEYYQSWAFRCAQEPLKAANKADLKVQQISKLITCWMLGLLDNHSNVTITSVSTHKQWGSGRKKADLIAEITLIKNNVEERHAVLIENKLYTNLRENQLELYKEDFDSHVDALNKQSKHKHKKHYYVFTSLIDEKCVNDTALCKKSKFYFYDFGAIIGDLKDKGMLELNADGSFKPTGNYMFDSFWFGYTQSVN